MSTGIKRGYQDVLNGDLTDVPHRVSFDEHDKQSCRHHHHGDHHDAKTMSIDTNDDSLENTSTLLLEQDLWDLPHSNNMNDKKKKRSTTTIMQALVQHDLHCYNHAHDDEEEHEIKARLVDAMWFLCEEFRTNHPDQLVDQQDEFLSLQAHVQVLNVMKHHLDCSKIQQLALHTLMNATHDHKMLCLAFVLKDLQTIVASMKMHSSHESIQVLGLQTLVNLCHYKQNTVCLVDSLDGMSLILRIMEKFSNNYTIVEASCDLIYRLGCIKRIRLRMQSSPRILVALAMAVETHSGPGGRAQMAALDALNFLTIKGGR